MVMFRLMAETLANKYKLKSDGFSLLYKYYEGDGIFMSVGEKELTVSIMGIESPYEKKPQVTAVSILLGLEGKDSIFCASQKMLTTTQRRFLCDLNFLTGGELLKEVSHLAVSGGPMQGAAKRLSKILEIK